MGKTITSILIILLLVVGGFWLFNRGDGDLARDGDTNATTTDLTGTGGPEEGFDPLEEGEFDSDGTENGGSEDIQGKG